MDSVLEAAGTSALVFFCMSFNPSFCGFGIGGADFNLLRRRIYLVSILVSVDSVLEAGDQVEFGTGFISFNPSFCGFGIGGKRGGVFHHKT